MFGFRKKDKAEKVLQDISNLSIDKQNEVLNVIKSCTGPGFSIMNSGTFPEISNMSTEKQLKIQKNLDLVFACIRYHQTAFAEGIPTIQQFKDGKWVTNRNSIVNNVFTTNPALSASLIKQYQVGHLQATGKSFLWVVRDNKDVPYEIWNLPPHWVQVVTANEKDRGGNNVISHFRVTPQDGGVNTKQEGFDLSVDEVAYTRIPSLVNLWDAVSPLESGNTNIQQELMSQEYAINSMRQLNVPGVVVKTRKALNNTQKKDLRAVLSQKLGKDVSNSALQISGEDASVDILNPLKEFDWNSFHNLNETRICMLFQVPPILIGAHVSLAESGAFSHSEMVEARKGFYRNTVSHLWNAFAEDLTRLLFPRKQELVRVIYDSSNVMEMQEDMKELEERVIRMHNAGLITINESREMCGYDALDNGDVFKAAMNTVYYPSTSNFQPESLMNSEEEHNADEAGGTRESSQGSGQSPIVSSED